MFGMKKERCGLCGGKLGEKPGILQYKAMGPSGGTELFDMKICEGCCDDMDEDAKNHPEEDVKYNRDSLMRKL